MTLSRNLSYTVKGDIAPALNVSYQEYSILYTVYSSVAEPHHFYVAPAPATGKNFDAAPALAPTLLYSKAKFLKLTKV
jgi:hypothetical protein